MRADNDVADQSSHLLAITAFIDWSVTMLQSWRTGLLCVLATSAEVHACADFGSSGTFTILHTTRRRHRLASWLLLASSRPRYRAVLLYTCMKCGGPICGLPTFETCPNAWRPLYLLVCVSS